MPGLFDRPTSSLILLLVYVYLECIKHSPLYGRRYYEFGFNNKMNLTSLSPCRGLCRGRTRPRWAPPWRAPEAPPRGTGAPACVRRGTPRTATAARTCSSGSVCGERQSCSSIVGAAVLVHCNLCCTVVQLRLQWAKTCVNIIKRKKMRLMYLYCWL